MGPHCRGCGAGGVALPEQMAHAGTSTVPLVQTCWVRDRIFHVHSEAGESAVAVSGCCKAGAGHAADVGQCAVCKLPGRDLSSNSLASTTAVSTVVQSWGNSSTL